jgi:hypothetical protein
MNSDADLLALEKDFWTGGARFYDEHLAHNATMVLPPPTGVLHRDRILSSIEQTPRWQSVRIHDPFIARPAENVAVVTYQAEALRRRKEAPYNAAVTSVYTRADNGWRLAFHQQSARTNALQTRSAVLQRARVGASAVRAMAMGALATGAFAIGALAVGHLAIGGLKVGRARVRSLAIDELTVGHVQLPEPVRARE